MEVRVSHSGLRMMLVNRESVGLLDDSWAVLGVYFLLGPSEHGPDLYCAYVGEVGKRTLLLRVKEHVDGKRWWSRSLLIASASDEFNSAEIGWLEGRLYDVLNNAVAAEVMNKGRPGDDSLELCPVRKALSDTRATLAPGGRLNVNGEVHGSLSAAAVAVSGNKAESGWEFWAVKRNGKLVSLYELRDELRTSRATD